ncbi:unnamed protein product [Staurois parvus]|uniref:N-acyl-aromatic-L-amino acid amidohydrolase n=1 Tax=Staurois parvus TaxID=386267 RepID=A0ABN9ALC7_9NEOB|nr:unnamed protein product [Staurois parvus]
MSGVFLVKHWLKDSSPLVRDTFSAVPLLSNPKASEKGVRYFEKDLNRCFTLGHPIVSYSPDDPYEVMRAKEINRMFGPRGSANAYDMMLDLHNTTSNMGVCLIASGVQNAVEMHACHYIQVITLGFPCRLFVLFPDPLQKRTIQSLVSWSRCGFELGPQPQGVVRADILQKMKTLVEVTLDFVNYLNKGMEFPAFETDIYQYAGEVDFPRSSDGEISAVIHPSLQDKDFSLLCPGDLLFLSLDGKSIPYSGEKPLHPVFINEAAYYEKKIAFILAEKIQVSVPALRRQTH